MLIRQVAALQHVKN